MSEIGLDVRARNAAILRGTVEFGSQKKLAELAGVGHQQVNGWATFRQTPWLANGDISVPGKRLAAFLCVDPVEAFPPELYRHFEMRPTRLQWYRPLDMKALPESMHPRLLSSGEENVFRSEQREQIQQALSGLTRRQRIVVEKRFGLNGEEQATRREVAVALGISDGRIDQIEHKAVRDLRRKLWKRTRSLEEE